MIILVKSLFCLFFKGNYDLITCILFKEDPNNSLINKLKEKWIYKNFQKIHILVLKLKLMKIKNQFY